MYFNPHLHGVVSFCSLARQHDTVAPIEHGIGHIGPLGARGAWGCNHRLKHLRCANHGFASTGKARERLLQRSKWEKALFKLEAGLLPPLSYSTSLFSCFLFSLLFLHTLTGCIERSSSSEQEKLSPRESRFPGHRVQPSPHLSLLGYHWSSGRERERE